MTKGKNMEKSLAKICKMFLQQKCCISYKHLPTINSLVPRSKNIQKIVDKLAKKYKLSIFFVFFDKIYASKMYGPNLYIRKNKFCFWFHSNPARISCLPIGVGITSECLLAKDTSENDLTMEKIQQEDLNFNVWTKEKSKIKLLRRSKRSKSDDLHFDELTCKLFLIKSDKNYFRGNWKYRNKLLKN